MKLFVKERSRKGFTMSEVLVVVVILAITLAIAVPTMIGGIRRMNLNRLDDSARSIFLAAQNSMTAMVGKGEFEHFAEGVTDNKVVDLIGKEPSDFDASHHGDSNDLRYLDFKGSDAHKKALEELLPGGSIDKELEEHRYVVEYNCKTGAVYAVWYSDKKNFEDNPDAYTGELREYDERLKNNPLIGYYGGSGVNYALVGQMPIPELTLTNAEELRLHIKMPNVPPGGTSFASGKIGLEVTVTGKDSGVTKPIIERSTDASKKVILDEGYSADLMLDTFNDYSDTTKYPYINQWNGWTTGKAFKDWVAESDPSADELIPGEDISVTVTAYYADTDKLYLSQSATVNCNSLFASVEKKDDPDTSGTVEQIPTAMIAYGRHLQNLDALTATGEADGQIGVGTVGGLPKGTAITAAEQTEPIDFNAVNGTIDAGAFTSGDDSDNVYYWANTYGKVDSSDGTISDLKTFDSLYNSTLTAYNGNSLPIRNLNTIENTDLYAGLFSHIAGSAGDLAKLKNITLINPAANAKNNAGALAGMVNNVNIENCQVYFDRKYNPEDTSTPKITMTDTATNRAGGLVGVVDGNVNITDSFASVVVKGNDTCSDCDIGGLVGETSSDANLSIKKSYAACYLNGGSNGGNKAGGLVGNVDDSSSVSVSNSYADGIIINVKNGGTAAGLVTNAPSGSTLEIFNSYAAVRYSEEVAKASSNVEIFGAAPNTSPLPGAGALSNNVYYVSQTGAKYVAKSGTELTTKQLSEMPITAPPAGGSGNYLEGDWYDKSGSTNPTYATFPYRQTDETKSLSTPYPYPMLKTVDTGGNEIPVFHFGDWLENEAVEASFAYCEEYDGSEYGFYGYLNEETGTPLINTLRKGDPTTKQEYAVADGYGFFVKQDASGNSKCPGEVKIDDGTLKPVEDSVSGTYKVIKNAYPTAGGSSNTYDFYYYTFKESTASTTKYYYSVKLFDEYDYWFNTDYACEIIKAPAGKDVADAEPQEKEGAAGATDTTKHTGVVIRTARQLANLTNATGSTYDSSADAQKRDYEQLLDIDYQEYTGDELKNGKTDTNAQSPAALNTGGSYDGNKFLIRNLYIKEADGGTGLFGNTKGELKNIRLVNVSVTSTKDNVGALAGRFQGSTIENCGVYVDSADNYENFVITSNNTNSTGGLIGSANSGTKLEKCFAAVKVKGYDEVGGLIGKLTVKTSETTTLTNCYAGGHTVDGSYENAKAKDNVSGNKQVGGLIGYVTGEGSVMLSGVNYSTCSVSATNTSSNEIGLLVGGQTVNALIELNSDDIVYAIGAAFGSSGSSVEPREETYLTSPTENTQSDFETYPYDETLFETTSSGKTAKPYPYATKLSSHHGDWVEKESLEACFYWEKEGTGTPVYNVYVVGFEQVGTTTIPLNSGNPISTLCLEHHSVEKAMGDNATSNSNTDWGYGIIELTDTLTGTGVRDITTDTSATDTVNGVTTALRGALAGHSFEDTAVKVYTGATENASTTVTSEIDNPTAGGKYTYHLNLGFGAAISLDGNLGQSGSPCQIRNAQQLDNIPDSSPSSFQQTHDVYGRDYSDYIGASSFAGTYNGKSYRILELNMTSGLFDSLGNSSVVTTNLENIILYSPSGDAKVDGSGGLAGGLAGSVTDYGDTNIRNCIVAGYTMFNTSQSLGGLVGKVSRSSTLYTLSITNSEAVNKLEPNGTNSGYVGGLVGQVSSATVNITNSYAGGEITGGSYVGGIVGFVSPAGSAAGDVNYTNVYSYMKLNGGFFKYSIGDLGRIYYSSGYKNCHYLQDCFPTGTVTWQDKDKSGITSETYADLKTCMDSITDFGEADEDHSYHKDTTLTGNYPFPAVVKDYDDKFVHYGDWPKN